MIRRANRPGWPRHPSQPERLGVGSSRAGVAFALLVAVAGIMLLRGPSDSNPPRIGRTFQLTREPGLEIHPAISPDGNMVAYAAGPLYQTKIYVQQISGGRAVPLTDEPTLLVRHFDPGVYHRQDFASGAGQFFFTLTEHESDIWVMELESQD